VAAPVSTTYSRSPDWGAIEWIRLTAGILAIAAVGLFVLLLQYRRRSTSLSRSIVALTVLLLIAAPLADPWHSAWAFQSNWRSSRSDPGVLTLASDPMPRARLNYATAPYFPRLNQEGFYLPLRVTGVPAGTSLVSQRTAITIQGGGRQWSSGWTPYAILLGTNSLEDIRLIQRDGPAWEYFDMDRDFYAAVKDSPVTVRISVAAMFLDGRETRPMNPKGRTRNLPDDGLCQAQPIEQLLRDVRGIAGIRNVSVTCRWPRPGPERAYVRAASSQTAESSQGLLIGGTAGPLSMNQSVWNGGSAILTGRSQLQFTVETWRAAGYFERSVELNGVLLRDYLAPRVTDSQ